MLIGMQLQPMVLDTVRLVMQSTRKCARSASVDCFPEAGVSGRFGNFVICMADLQLRLIEELLLCLRRRRKQAPLLA